MASHNNYIRGTLVAMPCHTSVLVALSMEEESRRELSNKVLAATATVCSILHAHRNFLVVFEGLGRWCSVNIVHRTMLLSSIGLFLRIFYIDYYFK